MSAAAKAKAFLAVQQGIADRRNERLVSVQVDAGLLRELIAQAEAGQSATNYVKGGRGSKS